MQQEGMTKDETNDLPHPSLFIMWHCLDVWFVSPSRPISHILFSNQHLLISPPSACLSPTLFSIMEPYSHDIPLPTKHTKASLVLLHHPGIVDAPLSSHTTPSSTHFKCKGPQSVDTFASGHQFTWAEATTCQATLKFYVGTSPTQREALNSHDLKVQASSHPRLNAYDILSLRVSMLILAL